MLDVIISVEATCDLEKDVIEKYDLSVIDMEFEVDGQMFNTKDDNVESSKLYEKMLQKKKTATSQINSYTYEEYFKNLLKKGKPIVHLAFSSGLSGTVESARKVADELNQSNDIKIHVIDSLCGCFGQGLLAMIVRDKCRDFKTIDELLEFVESFKNKVRHYFTVDTLTYLANGGRLDSKTAFFGNLLNIKPVLELSKFGKLEVMHKVISRKKSLASLADLTIKSFDENYPYCFIGHSASVKDAVFLKEKIESLSNIKPVICNLGPILGCHSGPGTISIFFAGKNNR